MQATLHLSPVKCCLTIFWIIEAIPVFDIVDPMLSSSALHLRT